jgi:hypothetical protein
MNEDLAPLQPDELDELLSADLDGELAAAARERGSDVDAIRARIAATPDASARRDALAAARDVLADGPALDDLVGARLRAKAVQAAAARSDARESARRGRRNRLLLTTSGIAAAILVIAAIAVVVGHTGSSGSSSNANASASAPPRSLSPSIDLTQSVPALGSYTDVATLGSVAVNAAERRAAVHGANGVGAGDRLNQSEARVAAPAARVPTSPPKFPAGAEFAPSAGVQDSADGTSSYYGARGTAGTSKAVAGAPAAPCSPAKFAGPGEQLSMRASATLDGERVEVYVFSGSAEHTVVVLGPACRLVNVQTLA